MTVDTKLQTVVDRGPVIMAPYTYFYSGYAWLAVSKPHLVHKDHLPYKEQKSSVFTSRATKLKLGRKEYKFRLLFDVAEVKTQSEDHFSKLIRSTGTCQSFLTCCEAGHILSIPWNTWSHTKCRRCPTRRLIWTFLIKETLLSSTWYRSSTVTYK